MDNIYEKIENHQVSVAVVGLGYIGQIISSVLAKKNLRVYGIDINKNIIQSINSGVPTVHEPNLKNYIKTSVESKRLFATDDFSIIKKCNIVIVTVNTPLDSDMNANLSHLTNSINSISAHISKEHIVILKSTLPPLTTTDVVIPILEKNSGLKAGEDFYIAFSPERLAEGTAINEFEKLPIIIGGINHKSSNVVSHFWKTILGVDTMILSNPTEAEMVKLADNLFIDLNISLANELALLSDKLHIDVLEIIKGANTLPKGTGNVNILFPGIGVGGSCLTKDPWFVNQMGKNFNLNLKIPTASRTINKFMPEYSVFLVSESLKKIGKTLENSMIGVLGLSFKNNTGDLRETPTKPIVEQLINSECNLKLHDPWVDPIEATKLFQHELEETIEETIRSCDCVMILCGHKEFKEFSLETMKSITAEKCVFFDGRNSFNPKLVQEEGFLYKGIGR